MSARLPASVLRSLTVHIKTVSQNTGVPYERVKVRFVMGRFLARVFTADPDGWVLKGGIGMMVRLPDARHSKDVDMVRVPPGDVVAPDEPDVELLARLVRDNPIDRFAFDVTAIKELTEHKGMKVRVVARLGVQQFETFTIDLTTWRGVVGAIENHELSQAPDLDEFPRPSTTIRLFPLADQIADKLCALYEPHRLKNGQVVESSRYRDLVDLLLISCHLTIDFAETVAATEKERTRRDIELPKVLSSPGSQWQKNWARTAKESPLSSELHTFAAALAAAEHCYGRVLAALPGSANPSAVIRWNPVATNWS